MSFSDRVIELVRGAIGVSGLLLAGIASAASSQSPPSPVDILERRDLDAPFLDAVPICVPRILDGAIDVVVEKAAAGEWQEARRALDALGDQLADEADAIEALRGIFDARASGSRAERLAAEANLERLLQAPAMKPHAICLRLERARLLMKLQRMPEAGGQLARVEAALDASDPWDTARLAGIAFLRAEILYLSGRGFEAHIAHRKLASSASPRLALAARLRLTDLSFDAGKIDQVSLEYEALLPRATAFGASLDGWGLRAAEAALDAGDPTRALRWLERAIEAMRDPDARDAAEIRRADLELRLGDLMAARRRLSALVSRRGEDPIGVLAAVRAVDLGVAEGPAHSGLEVVARAVAKQRHGLRRYALGVFVRELAARGEFEHAIAVATRLAFDGVDAVVVPGFVETLDALLAEVVEQGDPGCPRSVRALGGRYGILIERASSVAPFAQLGRCFERMELPWLALPVYRSITRRFGAPGAEEVALPLARVSLATGDLSVARHMAEAALAEKTAQDGAWQAILAQADHQEGRTALATRRARAVLEADGRGLELQRGRVALVLARSPAGSGAIDDLGLLAERIPDWLEEESEDGPSLEHARLLEAALLAAHRLRREGGRDASHRLYRAVDQHAQGGALRASARFWLGLARQPDAHGDPAWAGDPGGSLAAPWGKVAAFEDRFESLRDGYASVLR